MELAPTRRCDLLSSSYVAQEARRNLARKTPDLLGRLVPLVVAVTMVEAPSADEVAWAETQMLPRKDAPVLATAVGARAELLVTRDRRHFGHLFGQTLRGVKVATLDQALEGLLGMNPVLGGNGNGGVS